MTTAPILPGATLGVLGSGQLGRMFAMAARRMGYRVHVLSPESDTPAGQVADVEFTASYDDLDAIRTFARGVQVVTFEFENVPAGTADAAAQFAPVRPRGLALHVAQQRVREKTFLRDKGFPVTPFAAIATDAELEQALGSVGTPGVMKTASFALFASAVVRPLPDAGTLTAFIDARMRLRSAGDIRPFVRRRSTRSRSASGSVASAISAA